MAGRPKGTPKSGGRKAGTRNKVTADIKEIAQSFGEEAVLNLAAMMRDGEAPHAARVAAMKEILDRGYGKAVQRNDLTSSDGTMKQMPPLSATELRVIAAEMVEKV